MLQTAYGVLKAGGKRNHDRAAVRFSDKCRVVTCEVEKVPGSCQFSQFLGAEGSFQTGQYETVHAADISPRPDDGQSMRLIQFQYLL